MTYNEFFNCSPIEDLIRERIEKAKYLLSTQTMSVSDVAYAVGYDNIYHFSRQFKKHTSISPSIFFL
ncbi:MAG: helix-turn-helix transcriptional regulator [Clostridiales bacterium]|nr:helix-turn-helix transcriptional regulator [Clostridiales bacterium]